MSDRSDRTDCPALELLVVAYHEAGHAVAALLVRPPWPVETVTILPQSDGASACTNYALSGGAELLAALEVDFADGLAAGLRSNATACLAGPLAEEMFLAGQRSRGDLNDIRRAASIAEMWLVLSGRNTAGTASVFQSRVAEIPERLPWLLSEPGLDDELVRFVSEAARSAQQILEAPRVFRLVGLVAGALMRQKTLNGSEVEALVRRAKDGE